MRRPGSGPEDTKVFLIEAGLKRWIITGEWLQLHGYRLGDAKLISAEELAAIPSGEEIQ